MSHTHEKQRTLILTFSACRCGTGGRGRCQRGLSLISRSRSRCSHRRHAGQVHGAHAMGEIDTVRGQGQGEGELLHAEAACVRHVVLVDHGGQDGVVARTTRRCQR